MCMAIPSRIIALNDMMATVECFGEQRDVSLMLLVEEVTLGDYVLVQAGSFAYQKVEPDLAQEALYYFSKAIATPAS